MSAEPQFDRASFDSEKIFPPALSAELRVKHWFGLQVKIVIVILSKVSKWLELKNN